MSSRDKLDDLLVDQALWGLSDEERRELGQVMDELGIRARDGSFETTAAAVTSALIQSDPENAPAALIRRVEADAICYFAHHHEVPLKLVADVVDSPARVAPVHRPRALPSEPLPSEPVPSEVAAQQPRGSKLPWLLAAAAALMAVVIGWNQLAPQATPTESRQALLASGAPVMKIDWNAGPSELRGDPSGDVVWSDATQSGYMTFRGLPPNDGGKRQYQLWIFDKGRSAERPVDGGVFDIPSDGGQVVIPIDAKIRVKEAFAFAVTVEAPGGVVVSDREHIVTTAGL